MYIYIILAVVALCIIACLSFFFSTPKAKGKRGEHLVRRIIGKTKVNEKYVFNDYIIENGDKSSQIDHILINPYGVFVIETKNYSGKIYGSKNQDKWIQVLQYGKIKNELYNPLKQNATHIYRLKNILGDVPFRSLVVFTQNNTEHISSENVIPVKYLHKIINRGEIVLTGEEMNLISQALETNRSSLNIKDHIKNIRKQQQDLQEGICPRCGGHLVIRNGKYGQFYGCSNYPSCKFTKKI